MPSRRPGQRRDSLNLRVGQRRLLRKRGRNVRRPNAARRRGVGHVHAMLGHDAPLDDPARAIDQPRVGVRLARDDRGAEARHGAHHGHAAAPRNRIGAERHTGGARRDHALDQHRRGMRQQRQAVLAPVRENPIGESRLPDRTHLLRDVGGRHVQEAFELTGKRMLGTVLVAGRRSDGHELAGRREPTDRLRYRGDDGRRQRNGVEHASESASASVAASSAVRCSGVRLSANARGGQREPWRHRQSGAFRASERPGLAAGVRRVDRLRRAENPAAHRHSLIRQRRGAETEVHQHGPDAGHQLDRLSASGRGPANDASGHGDTRAHERREQHQHRHVGADARGRPPRGEGRDQHAPGATRATAPSCPRARCRSRRRVPRRPARASCVRSRSPVRSGS